ncbi:MAG: hypothetical protein FJ138_14035, partial [Deltaproteobacteria bacterium]|nr:hypothetical protein [Deltaproteobacteria bacterium]
MSYEHHITLNDEARRYLKHHAVLEAARRRAHAFLSQTWLQLARLLGQELRESGVEGAWLELTRQGEEVVGVRWRATLGGHLCTLELGDARRWAHLSGERVGFSFAGHSPEAAARLRAGLTARALLAALPESLLPRGELLMFGEGEERVMFAPLPLEGESPKREARALLALAATLWGVAEGAAGAPPPPEPPRARFASAAP